MNSNRSSSTLALLIAFVSVLGLGVVAGALAGWENEDEVLLISLATLAVFSEIFDFSPFPNSRISISFGLILAAGMLGGLQGVAAVASATAMADYAVHRTHPAKSIFNLATLILSGAAYVGVLEALTTPSDGDSIASLGPAVFGTFIAFFVNSGLLTMAISLETGNHPWTVWNVNFRWTLPHYVILGVLAVFTAATYDRWALPGLTLLASPLLMTWLAMKQYTDSTADLSSDASRP